MATKKTPTSSSFIVIIFFALVSILTFLLVSQTTSIQTDVRSRATPLKACIITGCSQTVCADHEIISTCEAIPEHACYEHAVCGRKDNGECGWIDEEAIRSCLDRYDRGTNPGPFQPCIKTGCNGTVCAEDELISTCEAIPEHACYNGKTCGRTTNGQCGWLQMDAINQCLQSYRITPNPTIPVPSPILCQPRPSCLDQEPLCVLDTPEQGWCANERNPISWSTQYAKVTADDFNLFVNGKLFTARNAQVNIHSDPGTNSYTTLETTWNEHNREMRWFIYFSYTPQDFWKVTEMRVYDGNENGDWIYFDGFVGNEFGRAYINSVARFISQNQRATLVLSNLHVQPFIHLVTPTPTLSPIPNAPQWFYLLPDNLRWFLENLYYTIFVWERESPLRHLLNGIV